MKMKKRAFLWIVAAGIFWGTSGIFVHYMAPYGFSSLQMTAVRGTVSCIVMSLLLLCRQPALFLVTPRELLLCACGGLGFFGTAACYYASMQLAGVATAVVLMYTAPVLVMLYSVLFLGERFTLFKGILIACMLVGCALVSGVVSGMGLAPLGILLGLLSAFCYAAYNIFTKISLRRGTNASTVTLYTFLFMAMAALLFCQPAKIVTHAAKAPLAVLLWSVGLGIVTSVVPYFLYALALRVLPAGTASALSIVEPMAATLFSVFLLREPLDLYAVIGILLILLSVALLSRAEEVSPKKAGGASADGRR